MTKKKQIKAYIITKGAIKDDFCNYTFDITNGPGTGDTHIVTGRGIIDEDLREAMAGFNVHLAIIDDAFKDSKETALIKLRKDDITFQYQVTGFRISGDQDDESIVLIGSKKVNCSFERMKIESPKIPFNMSSYKFSDELKQVSDAARLEVELYKEGKCTNPDPEPKEDKTQLKITDTDLDSGRV